ncbi:6,7-dimethyl-8-ribityllumazine synthase [Candidatus Pelagibacter bacterium]|nr:6,7-dimethyl-8-ribityllumazine synthase [Candidatus Pelagibacter bacterium]MDA9624864.1 6,7-dimethyl-8-ribityllumazine synthase [Candidatus Pelagibacter bacterium]
MKTILIVNANYYKDISELLVKDAKKILKNKKIKAKIINVPGVFEIPIVLSKYINKFDGFIALGCVIKGKTPHFDLICKSSFDAIMKLSIRNNKVIGNGIITALNMKQAKERCSYNNSASKPNKGSEAAKAVISVLENELKSV